MNPGTKEEIIERGTQVLQVLGVVAAYFGIVAVLLYPILRAGGYLP